MASAPAPTDRDLHTLLIPSDGGAGHSISQPAAVTESNEASLWGRLRSSYASFGDTVRPLPSRLNDASKPVSSACGAWLRPVTNPLNTRFAPCIKRGQRWVAQRRLFYILAFVILGWTIAALYFYFAVLHELSVTDSDASLCVVSACISDKIHDVLDGSDDKSSTHFEVHGITAFGPALLMGALPTAFLLYMIILAFSVTSQPAVFTTMQIVSAVSFLVWTGEYYFGPKKFLLTPTSQMMMSISVTLLVFALILSSSWSIAKFMRLRLALEKAANDFDAGGNAKAALALRGLIKASSEKLIQLHMDLELARCQIADFERVMQINGENVELVKKIGKGASGDVWLANSTVSDKPVAVKLLRDISESLLLGQDTDAVEELEREAQVLRSLRHRNIVLFHGAGSKDGRIMLVTEYMERGTLRNVLDTPTVQLSEAMRLGFALDVASGLQYLHSREPCRVHRDLKTPNLLVTDSYVVKLADFGSAKPMQGMADMLQGTKESHGTEHDAQSTTFSLQEDSTSRLHTTFVGTLLWQAPEVLDGNTDYGPAVDVFSFAVIMYEIATRMLPWRDVKYNWTIHDKVVSGERPSQVDCAEIMSTQYCQLMTRCWAHDPQERPTMLEVELDLRVQQRALQPAEGGQSTI